MVKEFLIQMQKIAFLTDYSEGNIASSDLVITSAGITTVKKYDETTNQPLGKSDYLLHYLQSGTGYHTFDGNTVTIPTGTAVLYKPDEPRVYTYRKTDNAVVAWVRFEGQQVEGVLKKLGLANKHTITVNNGSGIFKYIDAICDEYTKKDTGYKFSVKANLTKILVDLSRNSADAAQSRQEQLIASICEKLSNEFYLNYSNSHYAAECSLSISHFNALFKKYTGTSPLKYRMNIRLWRARSLLLNSDYRIGEIATLIGFDDPLYFCKYFAKKYGMSPSEFRENNKGDN